ncbi:4853_t:CDS:1, partial [Funneliformis mosseae]
NISKIENTANVFIIIEEVETLKNKVIENNNNQIKNNKFNLDKLLETKDLLDK